MPWAAHSYNVAFSHEIGHFEYCNRVNPLGKCVNYGVNDLKKDGDDVACFDASASLLVKVSSCLHGLRLRWDLVPARLVGDTRRSERRPTAASGVVPVHESVIGRLELRTWRSRRTYHGTFIPGTTNTFGGTSTSEYGSLLKLLYADFPGVPGTAPFFEDFRNVLSTNPCPSTGQLPS